MNFLTLFFISSILFLSSCAPRALGPPMLAERSLDQAIAEMNGISRIDTTFSILFEKADSEIRGDGDLNIFENGNLDMRIYSLGILAMELTSHNGVVKSTPRLDSTKKAALTKGLRDCLFWWDMKDFTVQDEAGDYLMRNAEREITIDKKSALPMKQQIYFPDGKVLTISYDTPVRGNGIVYQSKMKIELSKYSVTLLIKDIQFLR